MAWIEIDEDTRRRLQGRTAAEVALFYHLWANHASSARGRVGMIVASELQQRPAETADLVSTFPSRLNAKRMDAAINALFDAGLVDLAPWPKGGECLILPSFVRAHRAHANSVRSSSDPATIMAQELTPKSCNTAEDAACGKPVDNSAKAVDNFSASNSVRSVSDPTTLTGQALTPKSCKKSAREGEKGSNDAVRSSSDPATVTGQGLTSKSCNASRARTRGPDPDRNITTTGGAPLGGGPSHAPDGESSEDAPVRCRYRTRIEALPDVGDRERLLELLAASQAQGNGTMLAFDAILAGIESSSGSASVSDSEGEGRVGDGPPPSGAPPVGGGRGAEAFNVEKAVEGFCTVCDDPRGRNVFRSLIRQIVDEGGDDGPERVRKAFKRVSVRLKAHHQGRQRLDRPGAVGTEELKAELKSIRTAANR